MVVSLTGPGVVVIKIPLVVWTPGVTPFVVEGAGTPVVWAPPVVTT